MATKFITVSIEIMHDKNLSPNQKFILAEIQQLSSLEKGCIASNRHFSELIGISLSGVSNAINDLVKKGYIDIDNSNTKRNFGRIITIHSDVPPLHSDVSTIHSDVETKENKTINKTINTYTSFKSKFPFIDEESFNKLEKHLATKFNKVTKTRLTNNIKKFEGKENLFSYAVDKAIETDYSGLFVPSGKNIQIPNKEWGEAESTATEWK